MNIEEFVSHLNKATKVREGQYKACCPHHEDKTPSMAVTEATDGRLLVHCYAGCSATDIVSSMGLSLSDLFPEGAKDTALKGATPWLRKERIKSESHIERARMILQLADADRRTGKQVSEKDKDLERRAWIYLKKQGAI